MRYEKSLAVTESTISSRWPSTDCALVRTSSCPQNVGPHSTAYLSCERWLRPAEFVLTVLVDFGEQVTQIRLGGRIWRQQQHQCSKMHDGKWRHSKTKFRGSRFDLKPRKMVAPRSKSSGPPSQNKSPL